LAAKVILNPYSGRWRAGESWHEVAPVLRDAGVNFEVVRSTKRGEGVQLAADAVRAGFSPIIAAGGDGTIGDVINGMMQAVGESASLPSFGVLPLGTANDLVSNLRLPTNIEDACAVIAAGETRYMDLCSVNGRYFANNAALGLEPLVTVLQERITSLRGIPRYLVAALQAIFRGTSWQAQLIWDSGSYSGPISLVSVGNGSRTGGLFYMTPHADLFDGKLTFSYGYVKSRLRMLALLPLTMRPAAGNFVEQPEVFEGETTRLQVKLTETSPAHADGELFDPALFEADYRIHPGRLPLLIS